MSKLSILIADDSPAMRSFLTDIVQQIADATVIGTASNGEEAVEKGKELNPDILLLDVVMPKKDGIEVLRELRNTRPYIKIIIISSLSKRFAPVTVQALALGAVGYIPKPSINNDGKSLEDVSKELIDMVNGLRSVDDDKSSEGITSFKEGSRREESNYSNVIEKPKILVVASSTGGPVALQTLLYNLDKPLSIPVVIVQHMPRMFLPQLAARLSRDIDYPVEIAEDGDQLDSSKIYIVQGEMQTRLKKKGDIIRFDVYDGKKEAFCKPSANPLFRSAGVIFKSHCMGIVLTGMGSDGLDGSRMIRKLGGSILIQDKKSSVVWGMPGHVSEENLANKELNLKQISAYVNRRLNN